MIAVIHRAELNSRPLIPSQELQLSPASCRPLGWLLSSEASVSPLVPRVEWTLRAPPGLLCLRGVHPPECNPFTPLLQRLLGPGLFCHYQPLPLWSQAGS